MNNTNQQLTSVEELPIERILDRQTFLSIKDNWSQAINGMALTRHQLTKRYHLLYHLIREGDLENIRHMTTNRNKLTNGHPVCGYDEAIEELRYYVKTAKVSPIIFNLKTKTPLLELITIKYPLWTFLFPSVTSDQLLAIMDKYDF